MRWCAIAFLPLWRLRLAARASLLEPRVDALAPACREAATGASFARVASTGDAAAWAAGARYSRRKPARPAPPRHERPSGK